MSDLDDEGRTPPTPSEGVRILGAEEAQAALDAGAARPAPPSDDDDLAAFWLGGQVEDLVEALHRN